MHGLSLRQVRVDDRWRLWEWRNSERIRLMSMNDAAIPREDHDVWFTERFATMRDRMVIAEWDGQPVGWFQIEKWDDSSRTGEWGNAIGEPDAVPLGLGGALPLLALAHAFGRMQAVRMTGRVLDHNRNMHSIMRRLKMPVLEGQEDKVQRSDGSESSVTAYRVERSSWPRIQSAGFSLLPTSLREQVARCSSEPITE